MSDHARPELMINGIIDKLSFMEERLRRETGPIRELLEKSGTNEARRAWKHGIYPTCVGLQLLIGHLKSFRDAEGSQ